jgi:hypothetical protein
VSPDFHFKDGLFSGYDEKMRKYNKDTWALEKDGAGIPIKDPTLSNPRCVFQLLKNTSRAIPWIRYPASRVCRKTI